MSQVQQAAAPTHRRSLRLRLALLVVGTGIVPFALAMLLLYPVFRDEVAAAQGSTLAREAALLASQIEVFLEAYDDLSEARRVVAAFQRGRRGRAYLYDSAGARLAGLPSLSSMVQTQSNPAAGWQTFEFGRASFYAGVSLVSTHRMKFPPAGGPLYVAIVQSASEVMAPLHLAVQRTALFFGGIAALAIFVSWRLGEAFLQPLRKLRQGAEIVSRINLGHRLEIKTGDEFEGLADEFNRMAESLQGAYGDLEARVRDTTLNLREERNRLATVLRTMAEGVVMANDAGEVVLMTPRARLALEPGASSGIGAPLSSLLPPARLEFHLKRLRRAWEQGRESEESAVFPLADGRLLRGTLSIVPGPSGERIGFLFVFRDLSAKAGEEEIAALTLREIPGLLKGPAVTIRTLAEILSSRPDMSEAKRAEFRRALADETTRLLDRLAAAEGAAGAAESARWPAVPADPLELLTEAVGDLPGAPLCVDIPADVRLSVKVEPYSWVEALAAVLRWVRERAPTAPVEARLAVEEDAVVSTFRVDASFAGDPAELEHLPLAPAGEEPVPLGEVVRRNRGELWSRRTGEGFEVRLALVRAAVAASGENLGVADEQPEFYDFDLFLPRPAAETGELLSAKLTDLEYVVFDTETTGLNPSEGDEIVSLSGVRVRRGKVAPADVFHAVVNPGRPIPRRSTKFHGIDDSMVVGAPTLAEVLPQFQSYVGNAILVGHNAAFDKKFFDLAAARQRLAPVENPILDTLFLSYGLHRDFEGHSLDAIARRLGITISGRHTSLGDARATAEIFLALIPLLATRGVATLGEAKAFCDKMLLFRWQTSRF